MQSFCSRKQLRSGWVAEWRGDRAPARVHVRPPSPPVWIILLRSLLWCHIYDGDSILLCWHCAPAGQHFNQRGGTKALTISGCHKTGRAGIQILSWTHPSLLGRLSVKVEAGDGRCHPDLPVFRWRSVRSKDSRRRDGRGEVLNMAPLCSERWRNSCQRSSAYLLSPPQSTFCWPETDGKAWPGEFFLLSFSHRGTALVVSSLSLSDWNRYFHFTCHVCCCVYPKCPVSFTVSVSSYLCGPFLLQFKQHIDQTSYQFVVFSWIPMPKKTL